VGTRAGVRSKGPKPEEAHQLPTKSEVYFRSGELTLISCVDRLSVKPLTAESEAYFRSGDYDISHVRGALSSIAFKS
jgi:hypothetical protein